MLTRRRGVQKPKNFEVSIGLPYQEFPKGWWWWGKKMVPVEGLQVFS